MCKITYFRICVNDTLFCKTTHCVQYQSSFFHISIGNFYTWLIFLHNQRLWWLWQIWSMWLLDARCDFYLGTNLSVPTISLNTWMWTEPSGIQVKQGLLLIVLILVQDYLNILIFLILIQDHHQNILSPLPSLSRCHSNRRSQYDGTLLWWQTWIMNISTYLWTPISFSRGPFPSWERGCLSTKWVGEPD